MLQYDMMTAVQCMDQVAPRLQVSITAIVLTFNEQIHLSRCLSSLRSVVERIIVVDSFSTDRTVEIARHCGAEVYQHRFSNQSAQFQWALDTIPISSNWIMRLDADEYLEAGLETEILEKLPTLSPAIAGVNLRRKVIFRGKWIKHGGYYPRVFLRLWRTGAARAEHRWMDEHMTLLTGCTTVFEHDFVDHNLKDITAWTDKHNAFATRQMIELINLKYKLYDPYKNEGSLNYQALRKRYLREKIFANAPLYFRGVLYFLFRYFFKLGILDGTEGFVFHFLQGCWNWILVDVKVSEASEFIKANGLDAFRLHLRVRYSIDLQK